MDDSETETRISLDVRPLLAAGGEPFDMIIRAAERVERGGELEIVAPMEPVPLYRVLARRGFAHRTEMRGDTEFAVRFAQTGIVGDTPIGEIYERYPATAGVLAEHQVNLCCGSGHTVKSEADAHGLDADTLLVQLQEAAAWGRSE